MSSDDPRARSEAPVDDPARGRLPRWTARASVRIALASVAVALAAWWLLLAPAVVPRHTVQLGTIAAEVMGTGTLEARTSALVGPKIGGLIAEISVDQGDRVEAGDLLLRLEDRDIRQQVAIAEAEVAASSATLDRLLAAQRAAEAVYTQAQTNHGRVAELISSNVVSQQDLDKAFEALSVAEAELSIAGAAIIEGQRRLDAAERSLEYQRARLQDTTIEAPFDALVVRRDRDPGDVVAPAAGVLSLVSTDEMWIRAWVDETELDRLHPDQPARIVFRAEPEAEHVGVVARVGLEVDRETREVVVDVRVKELPERWAVGQRAEVFVRADLRQGATVLPAGLLRLREGRTGVIADEGGRARWREVVVGLRGRDTVEILDGLSPGDVVVGGADLREGRRIAGG